MSYYDDRPMPLNEFVQVEKSKLQRKLSDPMKSDIAKKQAKDEFKQEVLKKKMDLLQEQKDDVTRTLKDIKKSYEKKPADPLQYLANRTKLKDRLAMLKDDQIVSYLSKLDQNSDFDEACQYMGEAKERKFNGWGGSSLDEHKDRIGKLNIDAPEKNDPKYKECLQQLEDIELQKNYKNELFFENWKDDPHQIKNIQRLIDGQ